MSRSLLLVFQGPETAANKDGVRDANAGIIVAGCASSNFAGGPAAARKALRADSFGTTKVVP